MDSGPFRAPRPADTDRRVVNREPQQRQPEPQPIADEPQPRTHATISRKAPIQEVVKPSKKRFLIPGAILIVIILIVLGWTIWNTKQNAVTGIDGSKYQAVFFTNGQVYFGKLSSSNNSYLKLTDIYYLQTQSTDDSKNPQQTSTDATSNTQLIKLGDEIHGPEDQMTISKDQVLFYENLKADGKVAQSIQKYKDANK